MTDKTNEPISLYIHIPFCVKKCAYCDFVSFACNDGVKDRYIDKLTEELKFYSDMLGRKVRTVFIGGGTPTSLSTVQLKRLFDGIRTNFDIEDEFSIEANPATVDEEKLKVIKDTGVNRISVGLQSIRDEELKMLGRVHDYADFLTTLDLIHSAGFENINVDLMSALPGATVDTWAKTLETVADMDIQHISAYSLIIEEGTPFYDIYGRENSCGYKIKAYPPLPDEETEREMYHITSDILQSRGFHQYEISNYAKRGHECRHNKTYWQGGYYIGTGLSAAGYLPSVCFGRSDDCSFRYKNTSDINEYLGFRPENTQEQYREFEPVTDIDAAKELFIFGLRMNEGVDTKKAFELAKDEAYISSVKTNIEKLMSEGLLESVGSVIRLTPKGRDLENTVVLSFV